MSFKSDVKKTRHLEDAWRSGIQALKASDRSLITLKNGAAVTGSVDVDSALKQSQPAAARWDYVISHGAASGERLIWLEVHPASGGSCFQEIQVKHAWLMQWMEGTPFKDYERRFLWLASGKCAYNQNHPKVKSLARQGISFCGRHLTL
jgi:hypothetical protein